LLDSQETETWAVHREAAHKRLPILPDTLRSWGGPSKSSPVPGALDSNLQQSRGSFLAELFLSPSKISFHNNWMRLNSHLWNELRQGDDILILPLPFTK
jgi:hypothetical protein